MTPLRNIINIRTEPIMVPNTAKPIILKEPILSESRAVVKLPDIKANDITINVKPYWVGEYSNFWITRSGATPRKVKNIEFAHDIVIV